MATTIYKAVSIDENGDYRSYCSPLANPLYYRIGQKTEAYYKNSLLYVCKSLEDMYRYLQFNYEGCLWDNNNTDCISILECETEDSIETIPGLCWTFTEKFWRGELTYEEYSPAPPFTVGVKSLVPVRVVSWNEIRDMELIYD